MLEGVILKNDEAQSEIEQKEEKQENTRLRLNQNPTKKYQKWKKTT